MERKEILNDGTDRRPADVYIHNFANFTNKAADAQQNQMEIISNPPDSN
jgi:hypothetical protein